MAHTFRIAIGDWSGDGHGDCRYFHIKSNKKLAEVEKAYKAAKKKLDKVLNPETFCDGYQDSVVPDEVIEAGKAAGCELLANLEGEDYQDFGTEGMCDYMLWFLKQGDEELELEVTEDPPTLYTSGFVGYGLTGN